MRMIPEYVHEFPGGSDAEQKVFELLKGSSVKGFALHSLNVSRHQYKKWAEIDFFCVTTSGVFALEVKGGRISRGEGRWFTNGKPLKESPFDQARGGMYALLDLIPDEIKSFNFGWGVIFPDSDRIPESPENPEAMQADFQSCGSQREFERWFEALAGHWASGKGRRRLPSLHEVEGLPKSV